MKNKKTSGLMPAMLAAVAGVGIFGTPNAPAPNATPGNRAQITRAAFAQQKNETAKPTARAVTSGITQRLYSGGDTPVFFDMSGGNRTDDWGRSKACARMVRKNRLLRQGIGSARI